MMLKQARWIVGAVVVASCSRPAPNPESQPVQAAAIECSPSVGTLSAGTTASSLGGRFALTLVATSGPFSGRRVGGTLEVTGNRPAMRGTVTIKLDSVGASAPGPAAPDNRHAVEVLEWTQVVDGAATPQITLRLGTQSPTPPGTMQIEAVYTALHVNAITESGFTGRWESNPGTGVTTFGGHFCASKL